jgi:hypothetical protein
VTFMQPRWTGQADTAAPLLDHGADINAIDGDTWSTPFDRARRWGHDVSALLIDRGAT